MWINTGKNLVNAEACKGVYIRQDSYGYTVYVAYRECDGAFEDLKKYRTESDAEQALGEIFRNLREGITAMRMPEYNW